ncbi:MAG: phenylalanine--tRNA ligase subunit beta, partial [Tissierellia bacterium]|nr:phenylalanine--tRNA ligase subunit beta [Tissierellia bacterium]
MLLPVIWLKNYVDIDFDTRVLADGLTDSGSHVESINNRAENIKNIIVGRIEKITEHPNADKLVICDINVGAKNLIIVTGAKNVFEGALVPVAIEGAFVYGGMEIALTDFRGVNSFGMLCSLEELGFEQSVIPKEDKDGILIFREEYELGSDVLEILDLYDEVIEFEITPNRPDCLSIIGMARETAASFDLELKQPSIVIENEVEDINDYVNGIEIQTENCHRYYSRVLKNVEIKPSPMWLQNALMAAGIRPVSNIVDLTNYVMLEYGQPLHAFDLSDLAGERIIVRDANEGEVLKTLDGVERTLSSSDVVIADGEKSIGIAGVMGGFNSEVKPETKTVLLEGANFDAKSVRLTAKKFGLRTEASNRFEKGIDHNYAMTAVERVCQLAEQIGAAEVVGGNIDVNNVVEETKEVVLRPERARSLLGISLDTETMLNYLNRLDIVSVLEGDVIKSTVPTFRNDILIEADLIEEIGRLYGFNNIVSQPIKGDLTRGTKPRFKNIEKIAKNVLRGIGYNELMTYSFISPKSYDKICLPKDSELRDYVKLINPLGEEYSSMRTTLVPNILDVFSRNLNRQIPEMYGYEFGNTFAKTGNGKSIELMKLVIGFYGEKDFYFLKESVEIVLKNLGIKDVRVERETENTIYHPGRCARLYAGDLELGYIGEIHPDVLDNYDIKKRVYISEINFYEVVELANDNIVYKPLPKYPSINRDLAFVLDSDILLSNVKDIALECSGDLLENFNVFDIYTGDQIGEGKKSVAFSLAFRAPDRTLVD